MFVWGELPTEASPCGDGTECHHTIWAVKSHSCALALFQNIVKTWKQREPIWTMCAPCSYFGKILYSF